MIENVGVAGQAARTAHDRDAFPLADRCAARIRSFRGIELDVVADEKIETAVAVVVEKGAARAPANFFVVDSGLLVTSVKVPSPLLWKRMLCPQKQQKRSSHPSLS